MHAAIHALQNKDRCRMSGQIQAPLHLFVGRTETLRMLLAEPEQPLNALLYRPVKQHALQPYHHNGGVVHLFGAFNEIVYVGKDCLNDLCRLKMAEPANQVKEAILAVLFEILLLRL